MYRFWSEEEMQFDENDLVRMKKLKSEYLVQKTH